MLQRAAGHSNCVKGKLIASCSAIAFASVALTPLAARAQQSAGSPTIVQELVVTAEKREQNLQDVPVAISAFSGDRLEKTGTRNIVDIQFLAAGLNFGQDRDGILQTSIRGISSNVGVESAVATHLDGVYLANRYDQIGAFFDVARVEVLRGPQGTLYGRNATGGAINIITRDPTREAEAGGEVTIGNYNLIETEGFVSGPVVGDKVRGRLAFKTSDLPGYGHNLYDGSRVNGASTVSGRGKLDWDASDSVRVALSADYTRTKSTLADEISRDLPGLPLQVETMGYTLGREFDSNRNRPNDQDIQAYGGRARVDWDLGAVTLTSLTGHRRFTSSTTFDIDGSPADIAYFKSNRKSGSETTEELNLSSNGKGPLRWIVGAYYLDNELHGSYDVPIPVFGIEILSDLKTYHTKAYAAFGQATYDFTPALSLTLGARYSHESNHDLETRTVAPVAPPAVQDLSNTSNSFTPKVSLQWKPVEEVSLYATYAKGFKSGGLNPGNFDGSNFAPEKVTNYELGLKSLLLDRALMFNVAAFYMDYSDLQVNTTVLVPPGIPAIQIVNAAKARIKGVEVDFRAVLDHGFSIDGNAAFLDAKYTDFAGAVDPIGPTTVPFDVPIGPRTRSASGNQMVSAPKVSVNLGAEYRFDEVAGWTPTARAEYSYQSRIYYTPFEDLRGLSQKPASVVNARLEFRNAENGWSAALWGRNLTDERLINNASEIAASQGLFAERTYRPPRTFGLTVGKSF